MSNKAEEQLYEWIESNIDFSRRKKFYKKLNKFLKANSQPLNLDVKVDDEFNPVSKPNNYQLYLDDRHGFGTNDWVEQCKIYFEARTIRERLEELQVLSFRLSNVEKATEKIKKDSVTKIQQLTKELNRKKAFATGLENNLKDHKEQLQAEKEKNTILKECNKDLARKLGSVEGYRGVWKSPKNLPVVSETGDWDGERTEFVLLKLKGGKKAIARCYHGRMDGSEFADWYDQNDMEILEEVMGWMNLPE